MKITKSIIGTMVGLSAVSALLLPGLGEKAVEVATPVASAQTFAADPSGQQAICRGGFRSWDTFISATISYDGFVDYWKDILVRYNANICHYMDIDGLLRRISKVRKQLRNAFFVCADTTKLEKRYYELEAELFFLRNYINTAHGQLILVNENKLRNDLRDFFVFNRGFFTQEKVDELSDRFKAKYGPKFETYKNCKDGTWEELVVKWNQFKESAGGIAPALKSAKRSIEKRWDKMAKVDMNLGRKFIGGIVDARINGLPAEEGWDQIMAELDKNFPSGFTFEQLQVAKGLSDLKVTNAATEAEFLTQYQILYKETSGEFTTQILDRLQQTKKIIKDTFPFENQTISCIKGINDKQC